MLFNDIVLKGALSSNGMASFSNSLSEEDAEAIHQFVLNKQKEIVTKARSSPIYH
jgi:quinohemoprotein ethanol dehydrogenase